MGTEVEARQDGSPQLASVAPEVADAGPFYWMQQTQLRNWLLIRGLKLLTASVGLTVALTVIGFVLVVDLASQMPGFSSSGSPSGTQGPSTDQLVSAYLVILGFFFFTAHLAPYGADFSVASANLYGVGALLITCAVIVLAYRSGRQAQRLFPNSRTNFEAATRAATMVVPYWIGCLLLFLVSNLHAQSPLFGNVNLGPSPWGLVTPLVLVGGSAALGAVRQRGQPLSPSSVFAVRGAVLALFSIAIGIVGSLIGAVVAVLFALATHSSAFQSTPATPNSGVLVPSGPSTSSAGPPASVVALALVIGIFYIPNGFFWLWGTALGLNLSSGGWLILAFAVVGALIGALTIRRRPGATEQISFAITFGLGSFLLDLVSRPAIGAYAWGGNPFIVLVVGLVLGTVLAVIGPYVAVTGLGRSALALPLLAFAVARLPLPQLSRLSPGAVVDSTPPAVTELEAPTESRPLVLPPLHFGRRARIAAAIVAVLLVGAVAGNMYASSLTTPEAAAIAYVDAVGKNNPDAIWSHMTITTPQLQTVFGAASTANMPHLLSEADLKAMLTLPQNSHQSRSGISVTNSTVTGNDATVAVSYTEQGERRTEMLTLVRDQGHNQYLFYPSWKVSQPAAVVFINLPSADSRVSIDGTELPTGSNTAVLLPGNHKVTLLASGPFASTDEIAAVDPTANNQVSFQTLSLTTAAQTAGLQAVQSFFAGCLQSTASSSSCPQRLDFYTNTPVRWQTVGDVTAGIKFSVDPNTHTIQANGQYLMTAEVTVDSGTAHRVSGGPYALQLSWDGQAFQVQGQGYAAGSADLPDPGAGQATILDAVKGGWQACLKATTFTPPDCPAQTYGYQATGITWTSNADPMTGAIVTWNGSLGIYEVTGNYSLVVNYTNYFATTEQQALNGRYTAEVVWDGQHASLVNIA